MLRKSSFYENQCFATKSYEGALTLYTKSSHIVYINWTKLIIWIFYLCIDLFMLFNEYSMIRVIISKNSKSIFNNRPVLKNKISLLLQIELVNKIFLQWKPYLMWNQSQRSFHIRKLSTLTSQTFKCYTIGLLAHIYTWITETKDFGHKMCRWGENGKNIFQKTFLLYL